MPAKFVTRFREKVPVYSSLTNRFRLFHSGENIFELGIHPGKPSEGLVDFKILTELTAVPFHSVQAFVSTPKILRSMIWDDLQQEPCVIKHLQRVPHRLDDVTKRAGVITAQSLLKNFGQARHQSWVGGNS
jgi:hypothetical protein